MPESPYPMISVTEAVQTVLCEVGPLPPVSVPFVDALGLVLASDVHALEAMPPFAASAVDGYAVIAADDTKPRRRIGEQLAGLEKRLELVPGTAIRITTGAPLPRGADAVVMIEDVVEEPGDVVQIQRIVEAGAHIRPIGQDLAAGQLVLAAGTLVGPAEIGLLATVGQTQVVVYPRPKVSVMSTGDELVEPGDELGPGQIRDSNRFSLMGAVREIGALPSDMGKIADRPDAVQSIERAVRDADALVTAGGVSMGHLDLVKPFLEDRGKVHFGRVRARPGKPVTFATLDNVPVFALPGFPVSALVCFEIYVRPALLRMAGHADVQRPRQRVTLGHDVRHSSDRTEFQRAVVTRHADGRYTAVTTGFQGSGRLLSMSGANALLVLPYGREDFAAGSEVEAMMIGPLKESEHSGFVPV